MSALVDVLRRVGGHPRVEPATALVLRARTVQPSAPFVARELARRHDVVPYRVRGAGVRVLVRHSSADPVTLGEVFHTRDYAPPPALADLAPRRIVDLGANVGYFGAFALDRWPGAQVVGYEPDPANADVHERTIALNALGGRWALRRAAAAAQDGELRFSASADALSHLDPEGDLVVPAQDVLPVVAGADLLKMDIEGGEWAILGDPRFAQDPPKAVVLEYHPQGSPDLDPHAAVRELLGRAGLTREHVVFRRDDGHGALWAWRA